MVETVAGKIKASDLGITLSHEHLLINLIRERRGDGLINDADLIAEEVTEFKNLGGRTIVDLSSYPLTEGTTPHPQKHGGLGARTPDNVRAIQQIARTTNLNVILGTGFYRDPYLAAEDFDDASVDDLAAAIIRDLTVGIPGTDAKAGVIGEIGSDLWFISEREEKSFRASALASIETGVGIYTHAARWAVGNQQVDLLVDEGVKEEQIAVGHVDTVPDKGYALSLAQRGVYVGLDTMYQLSPYAVQHRIDLIRSLIAGGHKDQILLSQDVCVGSQLGSNGGNGFSYLLGDFLQASLHAGIAESDYFHILTNNPQRFLSSQHD